MSRFVEVPPRPLAASTRGQGLRRGEIRRCACSKPRYCTITGDEYLAVAEQPCAFVATTDSVYVPGWLGIGNHAPGVAVTSSPCCALPSCCPFPSTTTLTIGAF